MKAQRYKRSLAHRFGMTGVLTALLLACVGWVWDAPACSIPVFRYALEHWQAVPCRITVFHRGAFTPEQRCLMAALGQSNLCSVETCDLAAPTNGPDAASADQLELWNKLPRQPPLPAVVLSCWGGREYDPQATWTRPFDHDTVVALAQKTPFHREVARRLLSGDSAVWILLTSPSAAKNAAAHERLVKTLREMEQELKLPDQLDPNDTTYDSAINTNIALKIRFSILEIPGNGFEAGLIRSALRSITTNAVATTEPVVIPVFGRGLALDALSGPELDPDVIRSACGFLCGSCSCSVKEMRIGVNLFLPVDWDAVVTQSQPVAEVLPPLTVPGATGIVRQAAAPPDRQAADTKMRKYASRTNLSRGLWALLGLGVLVVVAGTWNVLRGPGKK
jgi:hypothetical protein